MTSLDGNVRVARACMLQTKDHNDGDTGRLDERTGEMIETVLRKTVGGGNGTRERTWIQ